MSKRDAIRRIKAVARTSLTEVYGRDVPMVFYEDLAVLVAEFNRLEKQRSEARKASEPLEKENAILRSSVKPILRSLDRALEVSGYKICEECRQFTFDRHAMLCEQCKEKEAERELASCVIVCDP